MQLAKTGILGNRPKNASAAAVPKGTSLKLDVGTRSPVYGAGYAEGGYVVNDENATAVEVDRRGELVQVLPPAELAVWYGP